MTFFGRENPIAWPEVTCTADAIPPDPDENVVPEEVEELIQRIEAQAARLRNAAEVHFMRQRIPGYRNRSWRHHRSTELLRSLWDVPIEYATGNPRGIAGMLSGGPAPPPWYRTLLRRIFG